MAVIYIVRCDFDDVAREQDWNTWYSGPKLRQMLSKPYFLSGQRFKAISENAHPQYLALWALESEKAFETEEYTTDWGFFSWRPYISNWSRDLYAFDGTWQPGLFEVPSDGRLRTIAFDSAAEELAQKGRERITPYRKGMTWLSIVGLDRQSSVFGVSVAGPKDSEPAKLPFEVPHLSEVEYYPISVYGRSKE